MNKPFLSFCALQVRNETSPEDVGGMHAAEGILTARGGMTSHAAVVARGWGKCCVSGCSEIRVHEANRVSYSNLIFLHIFACIFAYKHAIAAVFH